MDYAVRTSLLNCFISANSCKMLPKRDLNAAIECFDTTAFALKLTKSFAMSFAKALKSTHAPIKKHNGGAPINTVEIATMPSMVKATKYPNGVIESNGNLKIDQNEFKQFFLLRCKYLQKWKW